MSEDLQLGGLRALVTGGTKGVGEAVVARLREVGVKVLTTARSHGKLSGDEIFVAADITSPDGCKTIADAVGKRLAMSSAAHLRRLVGSRCSTTRSGKGSSTSICSRPCAWIGHSCRQ